MWKVLKETKKGVVIAPKTRSLPNRAALTSISLWGASTFQELEGWARLHSTRSAFNVTPIPSCSWLCAGRKEAERSREASRTLTPYLIQEMRANNRPMRPIFAFGEMQYPFLALFRDVGYKNETLWLEGVIEKSCFLVHYPISLKIVVVRQEKSRLGPMNWPHDQLLVEPQS